MATLESSYAKHFAIQQHYLENCKQPKGTICAEYVWIDGTKQKLRSKTKILYEIPEHVDQLPKWNFDGSSTGQALESNTDIYLEPVAMFKDPFLGGENLLVLCETTTFEGRPIPSNTRNSCNAVMQRAASHEPWFGIEQEYSLMDLISGRPLGWPYGEGTPGPQGPFYCGIEPGKVFGRGVVMSHLKACLHAGVKICGINGEVMPSQWEYQVGPCRGIEIGDHMWMSRYILQRVAADFNVGVSFDPKIIPGDWNGAGAHTNFSSKATRDKSSGLKAIYEAIDRLSKKHHEHISSYDPTGGHDNARRLTGRHETASIDVFSSGVAKRNVSIRIPAQVNKDGCGYLEDRRPASNCDPYLVSERLVKTICLDE